MNFIDAHRAIVACDHYIRSSQLNNAWVYFSERKLQQYRQDTGDEFCIVISGQHDAPQDFHAIPFVYVCDMFTKQTLSDAQDGYRRWNCWIESHTLKTKGMKRDIRQFYGNTDVLGYPSQLLRSDSGFPNQVGESEEGAMRFRQHLFRERSRSLGVKKKNMALRDTGALRCEACGFVFADIYGETLGKGFIECHHRQPLSELDKSTKTTLAGLALVCSNCHAMLHRGRCDVTVEQLAKLLAERGND